MINAISQVRHNALWSLDGLGPIGETLAAPIGDIILAALQARQFAQYISAREDIEQSTILAYRALLVVKPWRAMYRSDIAPWRLISSMMSALDGR